MAKKNEIPAYDFENRAIDTWNATTVAAYLMHKSRERFDQDYVVSPQGIAADRAMMSAMLKQYGGAMTKRIIDTSYAEFKPSASIAILNFDLVKRMSSRIIPKLIASDKASENAKRFEKTTASSADDVMEWL